MATVISAVPASVSLTLYQGDDFTLKVTVQDANGNPYNLTGLTPEAQIRATYASPVAAAFTCSVDAPATNGIFHMTLAPTETEGLPPRGVWDVQVSTADGMHVTTLAAGTVQVTSQVTRDDSRVGVQPAGRRR
jgi:hypothetical protein